ncbi:MAG: hypothetical protein M0R49_01230 [Limnochordia bacterium]|nr:hypothetical protein [Limnochordia bacterium]
MKASQMQGALLEYIVRNIMMNCGFSPVKADGLFTYENNGLFFINGRGAAHDADVLMDPPVQMPFTYPTRVLFECKAYNKKTSLPIIRNALGLRYDINEFEIVTKDTLLSRKNNRRAQYAIEQRNRYNYQVGIACIKGFTAPAVEFATNNKIPLLSVSWLFAQSSIALFSAINQTYITGIGEDSASEVYCYFKDRSIGAEYNHIRAKQFLDHDGVLGKIISMFHGKRPSWFIGLLETGDMVFLKLQTPTYISALFDTQINKGFKARLHYSERLPELWFLSVLSNSTDQIQVEFEFFVPHGIMRLWAEHENSRQSALEIKQRFFSRIFIFNNEINSDMPFVLINIDREWINKILEA